MLIASGQPYSPEIDLASDTDWHWLEGAIEYIELCIGQRLPQAQGLLVGVGPCTPLHTCTDGGLCRAIGVEKVSSFYPTCHQSHRTGISGHDQRLQAWQVFARRDCKHRRR